METITTPNASALVEVAGARLARDYGDREAELAALRDDVGLVDLGRRTLIELTGRDRAAFLHRFVTNKIDALAAGQGREAFLTDAKAHVQAWLLVLVESDSLVLDADPGSAAAILPHLDYYLLREDVVLTDRTDAWTALMLAGPRADGLLESLGAELPGHGHLDHVTTSLASRPVALTRVDLGNGRPTVWGRCDGHDAPALWSAIVEAGARPCGWDAAESLRIEAGWPQFGRDVTEANLPQEVARDQRAISFDKGCYLGQETVARIDARGHVNRRLVRLRLSGDRLPADGTTLSASDRPVGTVTSAAHAFRPGEVALLGYVRRDYDRPGTELGCPEGPAVVLPPAKAAPPAGP